MSNPIKYFYGEYAIFSNFYPCSVEYEGLIYPTSEHAYQAAKTKDLEIKKQFLKNIDPKWAKKFGRYLILRNDWEDIKLDVMYQILKCKFSQNSFLKQKLLDSGDRELIEGNRWGDTFWGVCNGKGKNNLGKLLMQLREELKNG